ncbi:uncharacterized protein [Aristolochia californica]|uniref:uncharacterized protein n=1 Tax=Aristolochia californica TaxID=171875 RepID=UPI0035D88356
MQFLPVTFGESTFDYTTEVVNHMMEMYLRIFVGDRPQRWIEWLPWGEYCHNTSFHTTLQATPFKVLYGRDPPRLLSYIAGSTRVDALDQALLDHDQVLQAATQRLKKAQARMKEYYDRGHKDVTYKPDDYVWLHLQPYPSVLTPVKEGCVLIQWADTNAMTATWEDIPPGLSCLRA